MSSTPPTRYCPQCGAPRRSTAKVCPRCGYRFSVTEPADPISMAKVATPPTEAPVEPPIVQSDSLAEPVSRQIHAAPPPPGSARPIYDLSGDPAPYISKEDFDRIRTEGRPTLFQRIGGLLRSIFGGSGS